MTVIRIGGIIVGALAGNPEISICIVNTDGCALLLACLESIFANPPDADFEVLVLDNASDDGSGAAVRVKYGDRVSLVELDRRRGKADNDSRLMTLAQGRFCLLLNEDSELTPGAADALVEALESTPRAAVAGARLVDEQGNARPSAWRFPGLLTAAAGVVFAHRLVTVQSRGEQTCEVDWVQSAGMLVRKDAFEQVGPMDPAFFVYSDEVDWQKRAHDSGWSVLYAPRARIIHREQLSHGPAAEPRIVEFSRNRDLFVRKHRGAAVAATVRLLTALTYLLRAVAAIVLPGHSARRYLTHARSSLFPRRGSGLREAAEAYNQKLDAVETGGRS
jgi:N-acetylglucosaminyl-diphospho-decaprenol L-rhamnosyltransferase